MNVRSFHQLHKLQSLQKIHAVFLLPLINPFGKIFNFENSNETKRVCPTMSTLSRFSTAKQRKLD